MFGIQILENIKAGTAGKVHVEQDTSRYAHLGRCEKRWAIGKACHFIPFGIKYQRQHFAHCRIVVHNDDFAYRTGFV